MSVARVVGGGDWAGPTASSIKPLAVGAVEQPAKSRPVKMVKEMNVNFIFLGLILAHLGQAGKFLNEI